MRKICHLASNAALLCVCVSCQPQKAASPKPPPRFDAKVWRAAWDDAQSGRREAMCPDLIARILKKGLPIAAVNKLLGKPYEVESGKEISLASDVVKSWTGPSPQLIEH
ncbi:MAG TPA: hypothetical protein VGL56_05310 [Fimbriimonadaceae bacterium]